jgi:hypothetical protein
MPKHVGVMKDRNVVYIVSNLVGLISAQEDYCLLGCDAMYCDIH